MLVGSFNFSRPPELAESNLPLLVLNICFTHPEYRRHGVGRMLMDWGLERADRLGLETYVDATEEGKKLYDKYGFRVVNEHDFSTHRIDKSPTWREMETPITVPLVGDATWEKTSQLTLIHHICTC